MSTTSVTVRIPTDILKRLDAQAARNRRSRTGELTNILDEHTAKAQERRLQGAHRDPQLAGAEVAKQKKSA